MTAPHILKSAPESVLAGKTRQDVAVPDWVEMAMAARWAIAVPLFLYGIVAQNGWFGFASLLTLFIVPRVTFKIYSRQDPVSAEIVFHNEVDGYGSGDSDDGGDGGD